MAIMKCPRCDGSGQIWNYQEGSAIAGYSTICPSCGGLGYVTDGVGPIQIPPNGEVKVWIKSPHCEKQIEVKQFQGTYHAVAANP